MSPVEISFIVRSAAYKFPHRSAVVHHDLTVSYAELDRRVDALAAGFRDLVRDDRPVASVLRNSVDTLVLYLALSRAGIVSVPINDRLTDREIEFILGDCGAGTLVMDEAWAERAAALAGQVEHVVFSGAPRDGAHTLASLAAGWDGTPVEAPSDDTVPGTIIYSSGTSGFPKGVVRTQSANVWGVVNSFIGSPRTERDVELFVLPMFGIGFFFQLMPTFIVGGCLVLDDVFHATRTWDLLEKHRVTRMFVAPTMLAGMLDVPGQESRDISSLGVVSVAYEFAPELRERVVARFGDVLRNMYGLTEAQLCSTAPGDFPGSTLSVGHAMGLARVLLVDPQGRQVAHGEVGEIVMETPSAMTEYLNLPELTAGTVHGQQVRTGDLGRFDEEGRLHFAGRLKEIIKSGGFNIDPVEVETVLVEFPGVREAALIGLPDEVWGERAVAFVAADEEIDTVALTAYCRERLAGFKTPKEIRIVRALPKNATGKIHRAALRSVTP